MRVTRGAELGDKPKLVFHAQNDTERELIKDRIARIIRGEVPEAQVYVTDDGSRASLTLRVTVTEENKKAQKRRLAEAERRITPKLRIKR